MSQAQRYTVTVTTSGTFSTAMLRTELERVVREHVFNWLDYYQDIAVKVELAPDAEQDHA
jgi:hypothetical protein